MICPVCQHRPAERDQVCDTDRAWLHRTLGDIANLHTELNDQLTPSQTHGPKVSGSRETPLPLRVDPLDLSMPARATEPTDAARQHPEDQTGELSVASRLDSWVSDWRSTLDCPGGRPVPTVAELVRWLRGWLPLACDRHPAIDEFAAEMRALLHALRSPADRPELKRGVPCRSCERTSLFRRPASDWIECGSCGTLLSPDEYDEWTQTMATRVLAFGPILTKETK